MIGSNQPEPINDNLRKIVLKAIHQAQTKIRWKPGKAIEHLTKRIRLEHLTPKATLAEYETIIAAILNNNDAGVYLFLYNDTLYPTLVTTIENRIWLVMIGEDGTMETAFPPDDPETYLADPAFTYLGRLKELQ